MREIIVPLAHGGSIRSGSKTHKGGDYVRVLDPNDKEIGYWVYTEWRDEPVLVMGAILALASQFINKDT